MTEPLLEIRGLTDEDLPRAEGAQRRVAEPRPGGGHRRAAGGENLSEPDRAPRRL
jgi:hypothetical protein